jgi:hypothetical protein
MLNITTGTNNTSLLTSVVGAASCKTQVELHRAKELTWNCSIGVSYTVLPTINIKIMLIKKEN